MQEVHDKENDVKAILPKAKEAIDNGRLVGIPAEHMGLISSIQKAYPHVTAE